MSAYVILDVEVKDTEAYARYRELGPPAVAAYGGRYLVRGGVVESLEGSWLPSRCVILEFPTLEAARAWWASSEYAAAKALRQASTRTEMILVEGVPTEPS
ncbi:MAG: hypothetical protein K0S19_332 [Geminicoccaceae bacterium]|nr:hypothetical protein [Geminicoccaceae bacterium]